MVDIKNEIIKKILDRGLPVGYLRGEADSNYGVIIKKDRTVVLIGYAVEFSEYKTLEDLSLIDLAYLLETPILKKKELKDLEKEECHED